MKTYIFILLFTFFLDTTHGQIIPDNLNLSAPVKGNIDYRAYKTIKFLPGFSYTANNSRLTAQIVPYQLPNTISIEGPDMICPNDVPIYTVKSSDGRLNGSIPENLEIKWSSYGLMLHPSTPSPPFHCGVSASLGGQNYDLYVTVSYNGQHVSASKTGIRVIETLPSFYLTQIGNMISTTIDVTQEERYGITGYQWKVGNTEKTGSTFLLPSTLSVGHHTVKCTVKTLCGERSETIQVEIKPDCGKSCPVKVDISPNYMGDFTLKASLSCDDLKIENVRWDIYNSCTSDRTSKEGATINLSTGKYTINCYVEIEGCFGNPKYAYVTIGTSCPQNTSAHYSYPNPANNILHVDLSDTDAANARKSQQSADTYDIFLYDSFGNKLQTKNTKEGGKVEFNVSNLTVGIYYIHMYNRETKETKIEKVMVER